MEIRPCARTTVEVARGQLIVVDCNRLPEGTKFEFMTRPRFGAISNLGRKFIYKANPDVNSNISESVMVAVAGTKDWFYLRFRIDDSVVETPDEQRKWNEYYIEGSPIKPSDVELNNLKTYLKQFVKGLNSYGIV